MTIVFIINPISGSGRAAKLCPLIQSMAEEADVDAEVFLTERSGHAGEIAAACALRGLDVVVAVGGDGTVNEVASALIGTQTALAVIPCGSGNGLARHLGLSCHPRKALRQFFSAISSVPSYMMIDACSINGHPFFCTAGIGFDAQVGYAFSRCGHRGLWSYILNMIVEFKYYEAETYELELDGVGRIETALLVTFANANQWGNNAFIAPKADISDGLIDVMIVSPFSFLSALRFLFQLMTRRLCRNPHVEFVRCSSVKVSRPDPGVAHYDGEPVMLPEYVNVHVKSKALKVVNV